MFQSWLLGVPKEAKIDVNIFTPERKEGNIFIFENIPLLEWKHNVPVNL